jgi:hypothetical protein
MQVIRIIADIYGHGQNLWEYGIVRWEIVKSHTKTNLCWIWGFRGSDYEECGLLGCKTPVCTSQKTHYISATESSQLMLCKIWGLHGSDYEECSPLGYKNPDRISQKTYFICASEPNRLTLCKIWSFHGDDYAKFRLLGCYALWFL